MSSEEGRLLARIEAMKVELATLREDRDFWDKKAGQEHSRCNALEKQLATYKDHLARQAKCIADTEAERDMVVAERDQLIAKLLEHQKENPAPSEEGRGGDGPMSPGGLNPWGNYGNRRA